MNTDARTSPLPVCLTVAGSDSGGGAGIQADLRAFADFGCFGVSAVTVVTAQNPSAIISIHELPVAAIEAQLAEARIELDAVEQARTEADSQREAAREQRAEKEEIRSRLRAEAAALQDLLASETDDGGSWTPVVDDIEVTPGYEAALGAALGDD